ncbi:MAG: hypothetical protein V3V04_05325 [Rhizobiaceae bacterium]
MIAAFDNTFLTLVLNPNSNIPIDPSTGVALTHCYQRIDALIDAHSVRQDSIIIPSPCLSEMLCSVPDLEVAVGEIRRSTAMEIYPFDSRCAIDLAEVVRQAIASGDKKSGVDAGWQEIKFDRQIAVIAKTNGAQVFYTDDKNQTEFSKQLGMSVKHTWELDIPPSHAQVNMEGI